MNKTQIQTVLAPVIGAAAIWLASKFPLLDQATWNTLITTVSMAAVAAFTAWVTQKKGLAGGLTSYGDTEVVTDPKTAAAVPSSAVVSNTENKVTPK